MCGRRARGGGGVVRGGISSNRFPKSTCTWMVILENLGLPVYVKNNTSKYYRIIKVKISFWSFNFRVTVNLVPIFW